MFPSWPPVLGIPRMKLFVTCCRWCCFIPPCPPNVPQLPRLGLSSVSSIGGDAGYRPRGLWNVRWRWLPFHFSPPSLVWGRVRVFWRAMVSIECEWFCWCSSSGTGCSLCTAGFGSGFLRIRD